MRWLWHALLATFVFCTVAPATAAAGPEVCRKELDAGADGTIDAKIHIGRDAEGRIVSETTRRGDGTLKRIVRHRYDGQGHLVETVVSEGEPATFEETTTHVFDGPGRLVRTTIVQTIRGEGRELTRRWETVHRYEPGGPLVRREQRFTQTRGDSVVRTETTAQLRYGPDGRLVAERRQTTSKDGAKVAGSRISYRYGGDSVRRRVVREERDGERLEPSERLTRVFLGDAIEREEREWRSPSGEISRQLITFRYADRGELLEELHDGDGDGDAEFVYRYRYDCGP